MHQQSEGILSAIGSTPLIRLQKLYPDLAVHLYAKMEMFNPGGSIKDRPACRMIRKVIASGEIGEDTTIIESSSGNMAIGLAQVCRYLGLKLIVVVDPKINNHTAKILEAYGAVIEKVTQANATGNYLKARLERVRALVDELPDAFWPNQYANRENPAAHYHTLKEVVEAMPSPPDYVLAATSTCGTIMGCANYIQAHNLPTKLIAVDAVGSVIFDSPAGDRLVPGHGAGRSSDLLREGVVDQVIHINDKECVIGCRRLLDREAILAGGSSGAVIKAVERLYPDIPTDSSCALILPDSGERYLDTIYSDEWVNKHWGEEELISGLGHENEEAKSLNGTAKKSCKSTRKIAIIGGGPKGTYGLERLAAEFKAFPPDENVEIHIYNKNAFFGAGDVYRPAQPAFLITNNPAKKTDMWIDEKPPAVCDTPILVDWLKSKERVGTDGYISRATVGKYLQEGFGAIIRNLPEGVKASCFAGEVNDIETADEGYALHVEMASKKGQQMPYSYDHILLATGHPTHRTAQDALLDKENTAFIPFIYPVDSRLRDIPAGNTVAIKGMGLTFMDAVLALTEGRGGQFCRDEKGTLLYHSSGDEPAMIYPFSRSGLPMIPRTPAPEDEIPLKFFTKDFVDDLLQQPGKLDFENDILPVLRQEARFQFYLISMRQNGAERDLSDVNTAEEMEHQIGAFLRAHSNAPRFDFDAFLRPLEEENPIDLNAFIREYLKFYLEEARKGELESPWAAATAVWRKVTPRFTKLYEFGGLTPASQHTFDTRIRRLLNRVTFGPPAPNMEKIIALMKANILRFDHAKNPRIGLEQDSGPYEIISGHGTQPVDVIVDARIPGIDLKNKPSPLYQNLLDRGLVRMFTNESYQPGCIDLSPEGYVIDANGRVNRNIAVTGTPTEGITFDNDTLSRNRNNFVSKWAALIRKKYSRSTIDSYA